MEKQNEKLWSFTLEVIVITHFVLCTSCYYLFTLLWYYYAFIVFHYYKVLVFSTLEGIIVILKQILLTFITKTKTNKKKDYFRKRRTSAPRSFANNFANNNRITQQSLFLFCFFKFYTFLKIKVVSLVLIISQVRIRNIIWNNNSNNNNNERHRTETYRVTL